MTLEQLTALFGWMTALNLAIYAVAALFVVFGRAWMMDMHVRMLGVARERLPELYFNYLARYKVLIIVFNLVPWIALMAMG